MKKILCPTDFSTTAGNAIAYAARLAKQIHAELTLLNVQSLLDHTPAKAIRGEEVHVEAVTTQLAMQCREVTKTFNIPCGSEVITAITSISNAIGNKAAAYDLIVMGTKGPAGLFEFFSGTNTYKVIRKSSTPVLLIPEACVFASIAHVVYAFDYWRKIDLPIQQLINFTKPLKSNLTVLQIMEQSVSLAAKKELLSFQQVVKDLYPDEPLYFETLHTNNLISAIHQYIVKNQANVLALCAEDHGFLESLFHKSVIKAFSVIAEYPVFVFHE
jgi:nucleotide-binding universal stress UspA family protein